MIMRRFLVISLLLATLGGKASACAGEGPSHNNYLFSVFPRERMNDVFTDRLNGFWREYMGDADANYEWHAGTIRQRAIERKDREMLDYLTHLDAYLDISSQLRETWSYPTKEQLAQRKAKLQAMVRADQSYRGTRFVAQYHLLRMRAQMLLGQHETNKTFWKQVGKQLPESVYRDMMYNIYAGALLHTGHRQQACDIYAEQGDMKSIKWCVRKHRNLAGIQEFYRENPNSPTLVYLVQDYVNNMQETLDNTGEDGSVSEEWLHEINAVAVNRAEAMQFATFANGVAAEGKTQWPALWKAAAGTIHYLLGDAQTALGELTEAATLDGTPRMKDNARAIGIVARAKAMPLGGSYGKQMVGELQWLDAKIAEERAGRNEYGNHYTDVKDRLCHQVFYPKYNAAGKRNAALAALAMMQDDDLPFNPWNMRSPNYEYDGPAWNADYSTEFFERIDSLRAAQVADYYKYVSKKQKDPLERYFQERAYAEKDYFCDLIGTKYMAEGLFDKAMPWLKQVSLGFLGRQNIAPYMARRDYTLPRWAKEQRTDDDTEGAGRVAIVTNQKLDFCKAVIAQEAKLRLASGDSRAALAYELGKEYYQASYLGECWYLTHYGQSVADTVRTGEKDFVAEAVRCLEIAKQSSDEQLQCDALFALAYIPTEAWCTVEYEWNARTGRGGYVTYSHPEARQYKALLEMARFMKAHPQGLPTYVSRCDVLREFAKGRLDV